MRWIAAGTTNWLSIILTRNDWLCVITDGVVYICVMLHNNWDWKCISPIDKMVSVAVADKLINVMLRAVFTRWHFEYVCNAQQCLIRVTIYNNLPNKHSFLLVDSVWNFVLSNRHLLYFSVQIVNKLTVNDSHAIDKIQYTMLSW